jgi:hypothetical protein
MLEPKRFRKPVEFFRKEDVKLIAGGTALLIDQAWPVVPKTLVNLKN